jgi:hypothetical protein
VDTTYACYHHRTPAEVETLLQVGFTATESGQKSDDQRSTRSMHSIETRLIIATYSPPKKTSVSPLMSLFGVFLSLRICRKPRFWTALKIHNIHTNRVPVIRCCLFIGGAMDRPVPGKMAIAFPHGTGPGLCFGCGGGLYVRTQTDTPICDCERRWLAHHAHHARHALIGQDMPPKKRLHKSQT